MTATRCPNGHDSSESDYCDVCGVRIQAAATPSEQSPATPPPAGGGEAIQPPAGVPCPRCGTINTESNKFCEGCGLDFAAPTSGPAAPTSGPAAPTSGPEALVADWVAIVTADRAYFDRMDAGEIEFPADCPERRVPLAADQISIGRRSSSRQIQPDIDLGEPPEDIGVSHEHATLTRAPDGSWLLADAGSTNGTFHNDDETPISAGDPVALADGDRIHVGAWTTITLSHLG
ncbi:MAG: FHA domain-containing protein [Solirubrobacteraceae bacterium]